MNKKYTIVPIVSFLLTQSATKAQNTKSEELLQRFNSELSVKAPEDSLSRLALQYARSVNRQSAYDSLTQQIVGLYPKGAVAATSELTKLYKKAKSGDITLAEVQRLKSDFPDQPFNDPQKMVGAYYGAIVGAGFPSFMEKDSVAAFTMVPDLSANSLNEIAWNFAESGKHLSSAEKLSKLSLDKINAKLADSSSLPIANREKNIGNLKASYVSFEDTYAYILAQLGKKKEALKYEEHAISNKNNDPDMNTRYVKLLNDNGLYKKALDSGSIMYGKNYGSEKMLEQISIAYKKLNNGKSETAYLSSLKDKQQAAAKSEMMKTVINKPSPDFKLKDLTGKEVALSDYKGKIVILDFWATWCGPCKMSFPGMQLAVNKYKSNPNVVFLFIDTWENTDPEATKTNVEKFIAEKKYTFNVLLDQKSNKKEFDAVTAYTPFGITGIPVKFFIGKDNQVKFMETGYPGSDQKVLNSVEERVEYLLKENS